MRIYRAMIGGLKQFSFTPFASTFAKKSCREREKKNYCTSGKRARQDEDKWGEEHFCLIPLYLITILTREQQLQEMI